jgi:hypothetical protein
LVALRLGGHPSLGAPAGIFWYLTAVPEQMELALPALSTIEMWPNETVACSVRP